MHNSVVYMWDASGKKIASIELPDLNEKDKDEIAAVLRAYKITEYSFVDGNVLFIEFREHIIPYSVGKMETLITKITELMYLKYPHKMPKCSACGVSPDTDFYQTSAGFLTRLCPLCYEKQLQELEREMQRRKNIPGNYVKAAAGAVLLSIGAMVPMSFFMFYFKRISAISAICYLLVAKKGYTLFKGKLNKAGLSIVVAVSVFMTYIGLFISYGVLPFYKKNIHVLQLLVSSDIFEKIKVPFFVALFLGAVFVFSDSLKDTEYRSLRLKKAAKMREKQQ